MTACAHQWRTFRGIEGDYDKCVWCGDRPRTDENTTKENRMKKKITAAIAALVGVMALAGCTTESYTFEANPTGTDAEDGWTGNPRDIECFVIEADSSNGDSEDETLGEFCRVDKPSDAARDDIEDEGEDDDE